MHKLTHACTQAPMRTSTCSSPGEGRRHRSGSCSRSSAAEKTTEVLKPSSSSAVPGPRKAVLLTLGVGVSGPTPWQVRSADFHSTWSVGGTRDPWYPSLATAGSICFSRGSPPNPHPLWLHKCVKIPACGSMWRKQEGGVHLTSDVLLEVGKAWQSHDL